MSKLISSRDADAWLVTVAFSGHFVRNKSKVASLNIFVPIILGARLHINGVYILEKRNKHLFYIARLFRNFDGNHLIAKGSIILKEDKHNFNSSANRCWKEIVS